MSSLLRVSVLLLSLCFAHPALASTPISGTLPASTTWTKTESPYVLTGPTTLPAGSTLTLEPGVIVKMNPNLFFQISGSVLAQGSAADPVIVTSITDDTAGGDTNGDGSNTAPSAGNWYALYFLEGSSGTIAHTEFRYGGASNGPTMPLGELYNQGGELTITDSLFTNALNFALHQDSGTTSLQNSTVSHSGGGIQIVDGTFHISGNTFTDTLISIDPRVDFINHGNNTGTKGFSFGGQTAANLSGTMTHDQTWVPDGLPYVVADTLTVPALHSLTILPGTVVHMTMHNLTVSGTLTSGVSGASERVTFTSPSVTPQPGDWMGINFLSGSHGAFHATDLRYGAHSFGFGYFNGMVMNQGGTITMDDTTLTDAGDAAIHHESGTLAITTSTIANAPLGIRVWGGAVELHDSSLHDLSAYGVYNIGTTAVDATNNWWGSFTGPTHPSHPIGTGAVVSNNVLFLPYRTIDPTDVCTVNCNSNVLFLPGIEASRLYRPDYNGGTDQLWEPNTNSDVTDLYLDEEGQSLRDDVYTMDVLGEKNVLPVFQGNVYKTFLSDLEKWRDSERIIEDYGIAPYDWRLSMDDILNNGTQFPDGRIYYSGTHAATTSPFIIQELRRLAASSRTGKVTIIAHSNGGMVAKALINKLGTDASNLVDKVVLVAVPQIGTPQAVGALLHGYDQGLPYDWLPVILSPSIARAFASTSPMAYQLLPSKAYFHSEGVDTLTPIATFDSGVSTQAFVEKYGRAIGNYTELQNFLLGNEGRPRPSVEDVIRPSKLNQNFLTYAEDLHQQIDDNWVPPPSIKIYQIAGFGNETLGGIKYWTGSECTSMIGRYCASSRPALEYTPDNVVDGDGTVVMTSALAMSTSSSNVSRWWVDLDDYSIPLIRSAKHANILEVSELRKFIKENILTSSSISLPDFIHASIPSTSSEDRLLFFLHSPLALSVRDRSGNVVNEATSTIPGGRFERYGEVQYISVPALSVPTLELFGQETGSFTLEVKEVEGNTILASTTFTGIPVLSTARVLMDFTDGTIAHASPLRVDVDGDGQTDYSLAPKVDDITTLPSLDSTSPTTLASTTGTLGFHGWYTSIVTVELIATDTESRVATTSYSLDHGATWLEYAAPFVVSAEGSTTILYYSTNTIGNREAVNTTTLQIDRTAPEAQIAVSTSTQDLLVEGKDLMGTTTVSKDALGNYMITDQAGHTTKLFFMKTYSGKRLTYAKLTGVQYDAASKITIPASSFVYLWDTKTPSTLLSQTIAVDGTYIIQAVYDKARNKTTVLVIKKNIPVKTQVFQGLRVPKLTTNDGVVGYSI